MGMGCGNSKLYWKDDLYRVSLAKHGKNMLFNKLRARAKRTATKRRSESVKRPQRRPNKSWPNSRKRLI